jgi:hypothetical protein
MTDKKENSQHNGELQSSKSLSEEKSVDELKGVWGSLKGGFDKIKADAAAQLAKAEEANATQLAKTAELAAEQDLLDQQLEKQTAHITVSTSSICEKYKVLGTVFAFQMHKADLLGSLLGNAAADPFVAFQGVSNVLKQNCYHQGGDAVINCQFNWETGSTKELGISRQTHMIYAYGTAVKFV